MNYDEFIAEWLNSDDSIKVRTSGSTGIPKEILLTKDFVRKSALRTISYFGLDSRSYLHSCISPDYIGGKMMAVRALETGCRFTWEQPSNRPLKDLGKNLEITLLSVVPSQLLHIISHKEELPKMKNILAGGAPVVPSLKKAIIDSGLNVYETYGMTETASHIALKKLSDEDRFHTLKGITVSSDDKGCLNISFDSGENFITKDLAEIFSDTSFRIVGRADFIINTGGKKVNPEDVERRLEPLVGAPFVLISIPDEKWGEKIVMLIESEQGKFSEDKIKKMKEILQPHEVPKIIKYVTYLARTDNGKINRIANQTLFIEN